MFEFIFDDAELEAINDFEWVGFEDMSAQLPDWIFLGHYVWKMDLGTHTPTDSFANLNRAGNGNDLSD